MPNLPFPLAGKGSSDFQRRRIAEGAVRGE
jgi:hypothetical protein